MGCEYLLKECCIVQGVESIAICVTGCHGMSRSQNLPYPCIFKVNDCRAFKSWFYICSFILVLKDLPVLPTQHQEQSAQ